MPTADIPALASPRRPRSTTAMTTIAHGLRNDLHLAPRPPALSVVPGYEDVPVSAESSTFALLERRREEQAAVFRALPAAVCGEGGVAARRGRDCPVLELGEETRGLCEGSCCAPWTM
jgi:hypothetical protein